MGAVRSQLVINDGMTSTLRRINKAMSLMLNNFEAVQRASDKSINIANLNATRQELGKANAQLDEMERNYRELNNHQNNLNRGLNTGTKNAGGLLSKIKSAAAAYLGMKGVTAVVGLSDTMTSNRARLGLIVDDGGSVSELEQKIYASAQRSRSYYVDTMATVSKLGLVAGKAFSGNDEIIAFQELVNKNFVVGGASATEQASAMYQLTQAMGSGRLQGDEYRSIIENAPLLAKSIEKYMRNVQGATGTMKDWASEGKLTAGVIKAAVFNSADEVEERFNKMPKTWSQIWTSMKNRAVKALNPVLVKINQLANSQKVQNTIDGLVNGFALIANVAAGVFEVISNIYTFMSDNWSTIGPIIMGVVAALLLYKGAVLAITAIETISAGVKGVLAAAQMMQTGATFAATAAQYGLNTALWACPITWIIGLIIALVVALVLLWDKCEGFREFVADWWAKGAKFALQVHNNVVIRLVNSAISQLRTMTSATKLFCDSQINRFTDMAIAIVENFDFVKDAIKKVIEIYNIVANRFGYETITTDFEITASGIEAIRDKLLGKVSGYYETVMSNLNPVQEVNLDVANSIVDDWSKKIKDFKIVDGLKDYLNDALGIDVGDENVIDPLGYGGTLEGIAGDTSSLAESSEKTTEELEYLRDIAEKEAINRFTTAEIKVDLTGMTNHIDSDMDIDGVVERLTDGFVEALVTAAEGVHV